MKSWITHLLGKKERNLSEVMARNPVFVDVRRPDEYEYEHISGAIHMPLYEVDMRWAELKELDRPVVAYCRSGMRSGKAVDIFRHHGIEAYNGGGLGEMKDLLSAMSVDG